MASSDESILTGGVKELSQSYELPKWFWSKVDRSQNELGCWIWIGDVNRQGYGRIPFRSLPHRLAYSALVGPIPPGMTLDHRCGNTLCVNPSHLTPMTRELNLRLAAARRRAKKRIGR